MKIAKKFFILSLVVFLICGFNLKDVQAAEYSGRWEHSYDHIYTVTASHNGNIFLAGEDGNWEIMTPTGQEIESGRLREADGDKMHIKTSAILQNGNIFMAGSSDVWQIMTPDGERVCYKDDGSWSWKTCTILNNGNILMAGSNGRWEIITPTGQTVESGYAGFSSFDVDGISTCAVFPNNRILLVGYDTDSEGSLIAARWIVMNPAGQRLNFGVFNEPVRYWGSTVLPDGDVFLCGHSYWKRINSSGNIVDSGVFSNEVRGNDAALLPTGNILITSGEKWAAVTPRAETIAYGQWKHSVLSTSTYSIIDVAVLPDGHVVMAGQYGLWQVTEGQINVISNFAVDRNDTSLTVSFDHDPANALFKYYLGSQGISPLIERSFSKNGTGHVFANLVPDTQYLLTVQYPITYTNSSPYFARVYTKPTVPYNLNTPEITHNSIRLVWSNGVNPETTRYTLQRKKSGESWVNLVTASNLTTYEDLGVNPDTEYVYRVRVNAKDGQYYYSQELTVCTIQDPAVAAAESARSAAEAAANAAEEAKLAALESKQYSISSEQKAQEAVNKAQEVYDLINSLNLDARLTNTENGNAYPPIIKSVKGVNNATVTTSSSINIVIDAVNAQEYKASTIPEGGNWTESPVVNVGNLSPGANTIYIQVKNGGDLIDRATMIVFRL